VVFFGFVCPLIASLSGIITDADHKIILVTQTQSFDSLAQFNCSVALYNCSLMAHSMGLGSCFMGFVQIGINMDKKIKHWLDIPKENQAYGAMVIGHPNVKYRRLVERKKPNIKWL
jgi:nitroreductase